MVKNPRCGITAFSDCCMGRMLTHQSCVDDHNGVNDLAPILNNTLVDLIKPWWTYTESPLKTILEIHTLD
ncbi:hypothetical protein CEXT_190701 [Caerostris extrusa]|uniref:Uncharacterized protein n=1 Tax=Caerostris extrusa TaxID=172846 RepID=A0AAV4T1T1_CAEEX|nr:hypothetical protein CEXT_190701 [Caerostris extrusa]